MDEEWEKYRDEAEAYCKTVNGMVTKRRNLGNAVLYNLIGLSLEAYLTAALMKNDFMPVHSSVGSMFRELKRYYEVPESFFDESRFYNRFMNFCALDATSNQPDPSDEEILRMVAFLNEFRTWGQEKVFVNSFCQDFKTRQKD